MDHQNGRTILHRAGLLAVAAKFLGKIGLVSGSTRFETEEKHACLLLPYRSSERHSLIAKHRTKFAVVFHCAPRARAWLLLQSVHAAGGSVLVATWSGTRIPRRRRRIDFTRLQPGPLSAIAWRFTCEFQGRQDRVPSRRCTRSLVTVHLFFMRDHAALGGRHLRAQFTAGPMECALVEIRQRFSRD